MRGLKQLFKFFLTLLQRFSLNFLNHFSQQHEIHIGIHHPRLDLGAADKRFKYIVKILPCLHIEGIPVNDAGCMSKQLIHSDIFKPLIQGRSRLDLGQHFWHSGFQRKLAGIH